MLDVSHIVLIGQDPYLHDVRLDDHSLSRPGAQLPCSFPLLPHATWHTPPSATLGCTEHQVRLQHKQHMDPTLTSAAGEGPVLVMRTHHTVNQSCNLPTLAYCPAVKCPSLKQDLPGTGAPAPSTLEL